LKNSSASPLLPYWHWPPTNANRKQISELTPPSAWLYSVKRADPDEICLSFGVVSGEIKAEYLGKCSNTLPGRIAAAARMADDAAGSYGQFLKEGEMNDSPAIQEYYAKCRAIRRQILSIMPERAFLEIRHITERFK
jgi:hypothetical protein